jgi:hypothetical protein
MWKSFLRNLFARPFSASRSQRIDGRRRWRNCQPLLELLEDRTVPSAVLFARGAGGPGKDLGEAIATDHAGNVYVSGRFQDTASFQTELNGTTLTSAGGSDGFVVKYRADGQFIWGMSLGGQYDDDAPALALDGLGDLYVTGEINNVANYGVSGGLVSPVHIGTVALPNALTAYYGGLFVAKLDAGNGSVQWVQEWDSNGLGASGDGIVADGAGNATIAGNFFGTVDFDPSPNVHTQTDPTNLGSSGFVLKLDPLGQFTWVNQVTDPFGAGPSTLAQDPADGTIYTAGNFETHADFVGSGVGLDLTPGAAKSLYLAKYSPSDGSLVWARAFASMAQSDTGAAGLGVDAAGNAYLTGRFVGTDVDFDPTQSYWDNHDLLTDTLPGNNPNLFVARYDTNGNFVWATTVDGTAFGRGVAVDDNGTPYVTGDIHSPTDFGSQSFVPAGYGNSFVTKMDPGDGSFVCTTTSTNATPNGDRCFAIAVDHKGFVDTTGIYAAITQFGDKVLPTSAGDSDVFIVKQKLECHTRVAIVDDHILQLLGDDTANRIDMADDGEGTIQVVLDDDAPRIYHGINQIQVTAAGGDDVVSCAMRPTLRPGELLPMVRPADLLIDLGRGDDAFTLTADVRGIENPTARPWSINVSAGDGNDQMRANIQGSMPVQMTMDGGNGSDLVEDDFQDVEHMPVPSTFNLLGGADDDQIIVHQGFVGQTGPGPINAPITVNIDGGTGSDVIEAVDTFVPPPDDPAQPAVLNIPLLINITGGDGADNIAVRYFTNDLPGPPPELRIAAPIQLNVDGGMGNDAIAVTFGQSASQERKWAPVMNSLFQMRLDGGDGKDAVSAFIWFDSQSTGQSDVQVLGGRGNDDLTLDVSGIGNPVLLTALIDGGAGLDAAHHTDNVRVINCER